MSMHVLRPLSGKRTRTKWSPKSWICFKELGTVISQEGSGRDILDSSLIFTPHSKLNHPQTKGGLGSSPGDLCSAYAPGSFRKSTGISAGTSS